MHAADYSRRQGARNIFQSCHLKEANSYPSTPTVMPRHRLVSHSTPSKISRGRSYRLRISQRARIKALEFFKGVCRCLTNAALTRSHPPRPPNYASCCCQHEPDMTPGCICCLLGHKAQIFCMSRTQKGNFPSSGKHRTEIASRSTSDRYLPHAGGQTLRYPWISTC